MKQLPRWIICRSGAMQLQSDDKRERHVLLVVIQLIL